MKLGIFGDSYATYRTENLETNWFNVLKNLYLLNEKKTLEIKHHGAGGASLFDSYSKLKLYKKNYDICILFITNPGRYPCTFQDKDLPRPYYIPNIHQIDFICSNKKLSDESRRKLENIKPWFNNELYHYHTITHHIMINEIKKCFPDIILLPCFESSLSVEQYKEEKFNSNDTLSVFYFKQLSLLQLEPPQINGEIEESNIICGHLIPEYSEMLGNVIYQKIKTNDWNFKDMHTIVPKGTKYDYYKKGHIHE